MSQIIDVLNIQNIKIFIYNMLLDFATSYNSFY
jgi:hypothetical protein